MKLKALAKNAYSISKILEIICIILAFFTALAMVFGLLGRVQMNVYTPDNFYQGVYLTQKDYAQPINGFVFSVSHGFISLFLKGPIDWPLYLYCILATLLTLGPILLSFIGGVRFFKNIGNKQVFVLENAVLLAKGGLLLLFAAVIAPLFNGVILPWLVNLVSVNQIMANGFPNLGLLFIGFIVLVMSFVFSYGLALQEEVDYTL